MKRQKKTLIRFTWILGVLILFSFVANKANAQEEIQQELYRKDSLIKRVGKQNIDTSYSWEWNQDSMRWELYGRKIQFYRQNRNLLAALNQRWKPNEKEFVNHERSIKSYNNKNKVVESLEQRWDSTRNNWVNLKLRTYTYDRLGKRSEVLYQEWKRAVGRWVNTTRYLIDYNRLGERSNIVIKAYNPDQDSWYNHQRYLFQYDDGFGPPDAAIVEGWNTSAQEWQKKGKYNMAYNFRGQKTMESRATWNQSIKDYINGIRYLISYKKSKKTSEILQHWDYGSNEWSNQKQLKFKYNEEGELKEELTYRWNSDNQDWLLKRRLRYTMKEPDLDNLQQEGEEMQTEAEQ
jgi:hypothetical protein